MKTSPELADAHTIVRQMPYNEAQRLRRILSIPCGPRRRARLIAHEGLPLGALMVADTYRRALTEMRSAA